MLRFVAVPFEPHTGDTNEFLNVDVVNVLGFHIKKINEFSVGGVRMFRSNFFYLKGIHVARMQENSRSMTIKNYLYIALFNTFVLLKNILYKTLKMFQYKKVTIEITTLE
jgi:hypothetical protein